MLFVGAHSRPLVASVALLLACGCRAPAEDEPAPSFVDAKDGEFDMSEYLASRTGFLPVPVLITEPAVGYGGGLGVMFLHDKFGARDEQGKPKGPPSITAVGGAYTESDTWGAGIGHFGSWYDDRVRYTGVFGRGHANLEFFGLGGGDAGQGGEHSLDFTIDGLFLRQELIAKVGHTPLFAGLRYEYTDTETSFDSGVPVVDQARFERRDGALAGVLQYDTRDSILTPTDGSNLQLAAYRFDEAFGGDSSYGRLELDTPFWVPFEPDFVLGVRPLATFTDGRAPFYALPYVTLRGVPAMRYQGRHAASVEAELRWNFYRRWSLVGFGGVGQAVADSQDFGAGSDTIGAGGIGGRYLIARAFGLQVGIDLARGPEGWAFYIQVGSGWH